jgi:hypothetical protein
MPDERLDQAYEMSFKCLSPWEFWLIITASGYVRRAGQNVLTSFIPTEDEEAIRDALVQIHYSVPPEQLAAKST